MTASHFPKRLHATIADANLDVVHEHGNLDVTRDVIHVTLTFPGPLPDPKGLRGCHVLIVDKVAPLVLVCAYGLEAGLVSMVAIGVSDDEVRIEPNEEGTRRHWLVGRHPLLEPYWPESGQEVILLLEGRISRCQSSPAFVVTAVHRDEAVFLSC